MAKIKRKPQCQPQKNETYSYTFVFLLYNTHLQTIITKDKLLRKQIGTIQFLLTIKIAPSDTYNENRLTIIIH